MATKKPKGWKDNPLGEINKLYNAVMPGGRDVTQPQSLAQFKDVTRAAAAGTVKAVDMYTTGGLGLSFAQNVIQPAATIASKETRTTAASKGMTQFAKDAAITAASAGVGAVAGKVVSKGAAKVVESGIPARVSNIVKRETVVVHGSPVPGLTEIKPNLSTAAKMLGYTSPEAYAANPSTGFSYKVARDYAQESGSGVSGGLGGSVYIAKAKTKDLVWREGIKKAESPIFSSEKSFKVVNEFPMFGNKVGAFDKSLKRAGAKLPKKK